MCVSNYGIWCTEPGGTGLNVVAEAALRFTNARQGGTRTLHLLHVRGDAHDNRRDFREIAGNDSAILNDAERVLNELTEEGWYTEDMRSAPPVFTRAESGTYALSDSVKETYGNAIPYK